MTNRQVLNEMTDAELTQWVMKFYPCDYCKNKHMRPEECGDKCAEAVENWMRSEVKDNAD